MVTCPCRLLHRCEQSRGPAGGTEQEGLAGESLPLRLTAFFIAGGFLGMIPGIRLRSRLSGPGLNRIFAIGMWLVAVFLIVKNTVLAK